jgi:hypothetical protein
LEDLGGACSRAAHDGTYQLSVPQPGKYFVCFISRQAERPAGSPPDDFELALMQRYFQRPQDLVGRQKYRWRLEEFKDQQVSRSFNFEK